MLRFVLYLAALSLMAGTVATSQMFNSSGEMNITSCPITYYGQQYDSIFVAFDSNKFSVCFKGFYTEGTVNDCIVLSGGSADRGALAVLTRPIPTSSGVHKLVPNLKNAGSCVNVIPLKDSQQSDIEQIELGNFGSQAILAIKTYAGYTDAEVVAEALVDGLSVSSQTFNTNATAKGVITDLSGCRLAGHVYTTNTTVMDPETCATVFCDVNGNAREVNGCGPMESCYNGGCISNAMCTVSASTAIDFTGRVHSIADRCAYSLLKSSPISGLQVLGVFQERRRKDVAFLDRVIVKLDNPAVEISLGQGGRVEIGGEVVMLNATGGWFSGVFLSKDMTGVTALVFNSDYNVSIHFDGNTALIHMTGPTAAPVQGLCGNSSTSVSAERDNGLSAPGCEILYAEDADSSINCNASTERCNLLMQPPFTSCHDHVNPNAFVATCAKTLCKYPSVDGMDECRFFDIYASVCSKHSDVTVDNWRAETSCAVSKSEAACQEMYCSDHEFCGDRKNSFDSGCVCRAMFASEYKKMGTMGDPTVCDQKAASLAMANCLLEEESIDYTILHLNDEACVGQLDEVTHMVNFNFNNTHTCGTVVMSNNSQIIYKNTVLSRNISSFGLINRHSAVHVDFSCYYSQPDVRGMAFKLKDSSVFQEITSGAWSYNLSMKAYTDAERTETIESNTDLELDQKIWVELKTEGLDEEMVRIVTDSCWATNQKSPTASTKYDLIIKGCPNAVDRTIRMEYNGMGLYNYFSLNMFQFTGETSDVFLHCRVELCVKQGDQCAPSCGDAKRRRRSPEAKYEDGHHAFITMAWT